MDEVGRYHKLSRPWHGPYRVVEKRDPDIIVCKVYFREKEISRYIKLEDNHVLLIFQMDITGMGQGEQVLVDHLMVTDEPTLGQDDEAEPQGDEQELKQ